MQTSTTGKIGKRVKMASEDINFAEASIHSSPVKVVAHASIKESHEKNRDLIN